MGQAHTKNKEKQEVSSRSAQQAKQPQHPPRGPSPPSPKAEQPTPISLPPQGPTSPLPKPVKDQGPRIPDRDAVVGWPEQPALVPICLKWIHGGERVEVEGSFDNWSQRYELTKLDKFTSHAGVKLMPPGLHVYMFIVDGELRHAPEQPTLTSSNGTTLLNFLKACESLPDETSVEELGPSSPISSYDCPQPSQADFAKEPSAIPPQLQLTPLNISAFPEAPSVLPRPQYVVLNHAYAERPSYVSGVVAFGVTHRYRCKYVSLVLYTPTAR